MLLAGVIAGPLYVIVSLIEVVGRDGFDPRPVLSRVTGTFFGLAFVALAAGGGQAWSLLTFTAAVILASAWITVVSLELGAHR